MKKILIFHFIISCTLSAQKAVIVVPVADLVGQPLASFYKNQKPVEQSYLDLAWAGLGKLHTYACPRLHQALFNEVVDLIEIQGQEARIRLPNLFYQTHTNSCPQSDYWTLRRNLITFDELKERGLNIALFPQPIEYANPDFAQYSRNVVTLIHPFTPTHIQQTLSAGTRFVQAQKQSHKDKVSVYFYNGKHQAFDLIDIPKQHIIVYRDGSPKQKMHEFVSLLRDWTQTVGTIPYVWGGCSITQSHPTNQFHEQKAYYNRQPIAYVVRPAKTECKEGVDCSGLIARAAQIVGIPYFYKNSYTIASQLSPLQPTQSLQEGDIIWIAGHVIIVASKTTIIEARHYEHGYGKIHEIPLSEQFKGINSTADLEKAFFQKQPLLRLNKEGKLMETYKNFKLLRLASVWQS
jgi:hypothetical protein